MTQVAIIGVGRWGKILVREFSQLSRVKACFHKGSSENEKWIKENYPDIQIYDSLENLLRDKDTEIVVVASPIQSHFELAKLALEAGKHVFVEKPPSITKAQMKKLIEIAVEKQLLLFTDNIFLYHPLYNKFKALLSSSPLAKVSFKWHKWGTFEEDIFWNLAYHDLYLAISLFGNIQKIKLFEKIGEKTKADIINFKIIFTNGFSADFYINRVSKKKYKIIDAHLKDKRIKWEDAKIVITEKSRKYSVEADASIRPVQFAIESFLSFLKSKKTIDQTLTLQAIEWTEKLNSL